MNLFRMKKAKEGYTVTLNHSVLEGQIEAAQVALDSQVWADMQQYMPFSTGNLINETSALNASACGTGRVYMYPPSSDYGHYQYEGTVYVDPITGKGAFYDPNYGFWSRPGVEKVASERKLVYTNPQAESHWGQACERDHKREWLAIVKKALK